MRKAWIVFLGVFALLALVAITLWAAGIPAAEGFRLLKAGAFGDRYAISQTLARMAPLLLTGLGATVAWRAGAFNIGGEGQLLVGALLGAAVAKWLVVINSQGFGFFGCLLVLCATAIGGMLWAGLAAWMTIKRGVDLVIGTILLNFVAMQLLLFMVQGPLRKPGQSSPLTERLPLQMMLPRLDRQTDFHLGIVFAVIAAIVVGHYLVRTRSGFLISVAGLNSRLLRTERIDSDRIRFRAMLLSGVLCGLAGGMQYLGISGEITSSFSQQYGFLGIPVALVGGLNPFGLLASSLFFGGLFAATSQLSRYAGTGAYLVYVIQGLAVLALILLGPSVQRIMRKPSENVGNASGPPDEPENAVHLTKMKGV